MIKIKHFSGITAEEAEAASKKLGWVDEKAAEERIGTGWWEEQKNKKENEDKEGEKEAEKGSLLTRANAVRRMSRNDECKF